VALDLIDRIGVASVWRVARGVAFLLSVTLIMSCWNCRCRPGTPSVSSNSSFQPQQPGLFISDTLKHLLLTLLIGVPLAYLVLWLMQVSGAMWWLYVWRYGSASAC